MHLGPLDGKNKLYFSAYIMQNHDQQPCHNLHHSAVLQKAHSHFIFTNLSIHK